MKKRAYLIFECEHGWCIVPAKPPNMLDARQEAVWSFSRLSQALWWLGRHVAGRAALKQEPAHD